MIVDHRVRAFLINNFNQLILVKRVDHPNYREIPGGGYIAADVRLENTLTRIIQEDFNASIDILKLVFRTETQVEEERYVQQHFFLCRLSRADFAPKTPNHIAEAVALRPPDLQPLEIHPPQGKRFLLDNCSALFELPDLR